MSWVRCKERYCRFLGGHGYHLNTCLLCLQTSLESLKFQFEYELKFSFQNTWDAQKILVAGVALNCQVCWEPNLPHSRILNEWLTHWYLLKYKYVSDVSIGSGNDLSPIRRQAITITSADVFWLDAHKQISLIY